MGGENEHQLILPKRKEGDVRVIIQPGNHSHLVLQVHKAAYDVERASFVQVHLDMRIGFPKTRYEMGHEVASISLAGSQAKNPPFQLPHVLDDVFDVPFVFEDPFRVVIEGFAFVRQADFATPLPEELDLAILLKGPDLSSDSRLSDEQISRCLGET